MPPIVSISTIQFNSILMLIITLSSGQSLEQIKRVIVDVDAGPDDAWAVFHLLSTPSVRIEAISCVRGNTNATNVGRNVLRILTALGRENDVTRLSCVYRKLQQPLNDINFLYRFLSTSDQTNGL